MYRNFKYISWTVVWDSLCWSSHANLCLLMSRRFTFTATLLNQSFLRTRRVSAACNLSNEMTVVKVTMQRNETSTLFVHDNKFLCLISPQTDVKNVRQC